MGSETTEWIQNFFVKSDVDWSGNGTLENTPHETQETKHKAMLLDFWNEFFVHSKINDHKQPSFLVGWALGHKDADIITLIWKTEVCVFTVRGNTVPRDAMQQTIMNFRMRSRR